MAVEVTPNLVLRFFLEMAALAGYVYWGWSTYQGNNRYFWSIGLFMLVAVIWGVFRVPGDPSSGGDVVISVPGVLRLIIELLVFGGSAFLVYQTGRERYAVYFIVLVLIHYIVGYRRIYWLFEQ
jgi:hypothetical protein